MKTINEYKIRLAGTAYIPRELNTDTEYDLTISNAKVTTKIEKSNEDGTFDITYPLVISAASEIGIVGQHDVMIAKKKGGQSKLLHKLLYQLGEALGHDGDAYYTEYMSKTIDKVKAKLDEL